MKASEAKEIAKSSKIEKGLKSALDSIKHTAERGEFFWEYSFPNVDVCKRLKELGYSADYRNDREPVNVSWI